MARRWGGRPGPCTPAPYFELGPSAATGPTQRETTPARPSAPGEVTVATSVSAGERERHGSQSRSEAGRGGAAPHRGGANISRSCARGSSAVLRREDCLTDRGRAALAGGSSAAAQCQLSSRATIAARPPERLRRRGVPAGGSGSFQTCLSGREPPRSEEHTSELQSRENLVCRLLLEKKKKKTEKQVRRKKKKKT